MNTFSLVQRALDATLDDPAKTGLGFQEVEVGRIVAAVQVVVDALTPPDGGRYIVGFADISTAQTTLGEHRITVSNKPLHDHTLSMVEKAVVIATFAAHEIGHTLVTRPRRYPVNLISEHNGHSGYHAVANIADDIILEPVMVDRFPILQDAFEFTGAWVLRTTASTLPKVECLRRDMTTPERFNLLMSATRYGDIPEIIWADQATMDERDWCRAWADRLIGAPLADHATFLALCDEAWERIRSVADVEPEPEPEGGEGEECENGDPAEGDGEDEGEGSEGDKSEGESEPGQESEPEPGEGEGDPAPGEGDGDDESESGEGDGEGDDGDEATDDDGDEGDGLGQPGESEGDGDDEGEAEGGAEGEGEGESEDEPVGITAQGESKDGQPTDPGPVDWDDDTENDGSDEENAEGAPPDDAEGGGGAASQTRDETDWDDDKVEESMHDSAERDPRSWDRSANEDEAAIRKFASTTVTAFGKHGSISTEWS